MRGGRLDCPMEHNFNHLQSVPGGVIAASAELTTSCLQRECHTYEQPLDKHHETVNILISHASGVLRYADMQMMVAY